MLLRRRMVLRAPDRLPLEGLGRDVERLHRCRSAEVQPKEIGCRSGDWLPKRNQSRLVAEAQPIEPRMLT